MNIGFIGAGKVGCTLGKYFTESGLENLNVMGYFSEPEETSLEAAHFTNTYNYRDVKDLIRECDTIFITVPDGVINSAWQSIKDYDIEDKIICHCSGAMSSREAFPGIEDTGAVGYSVHPLFAVSDRFNTYKELAGVFFTVEGDSSRMDDVENIFNRLGNPIRRIRPEDKTLYHCAAAVCSNLVCGVLDVSFSLMQRCGFSDEDARKALEPMIIGNVEHVIDVGARDGLTGPVERNDVYTVSKHMDSLKIAELFEEEEIYRAITGRLIKLAEERHPDRNYTKLNQLLEEGKEE